MKIQIITSCTGEKAVYHEQYLTLADFQAGVEHVLKREAELEQVMTSAAELYTGQQHLRLIRGLKKFADTQKLEIELHILSAGYGIIESSRKIAPYEATFATMKKNELIDWANVLEVPKNFRSLVSKSYDLCLILLGDNYLEACQIDENMQFGCPTIVFCGGSIANSLPNIPNLRIIPIANPEARRFSCGLIGLKGELTARILCLLEKGEALPDTNDELLNTLERTSLPIDPKVDWNIELPETNYYTNTPSQLRYFIPEWDDMVDPDYDFEKEMHSGVIPDWSNEVFAHQIYPRPNYDGILISREVIRGNAKKEQRLNQMGVHGYCRVPISFPIMGDCGAFGYVKQDKPPYSTDEMLDYYTRLGFDLGVSIDHLIFGGKTDQERKERYELTIHNAEEFISNHRQMGLSWTPIGAVQGLDPISYAKAAEQYVKMGYKYIALGGLVRSKTVEVLKIVEEVVKVVPKSVNIHLFGLARLDASRVFNKFGITSVDSASHLRKAWMGAKDNYWTLDGNQYAAIRIPEVGKSHQAIGMIKLGIVSESALRSIEKRSLEAVRLYDQGMLSLDETIAIIKEYDDNMMAFDIAKKKEKKGETVSIRQSMIKEYYRTLVAKPWKKCSCAICQQYGVEVIIFRGNNRNRRRGFHNTYVFYELLKRSLQDDLYFINMKHKEFESSQLAKQFELF